MTLPLVSCIMPTYNRRAFVPRAIAQFQSQDYKGPTELLIVDDGSDPIEDLVRDDERIRYIRLDERLTIGAKRNLACSAARGEIICHWDDDDWMADWRLTYQVGELVAAGADLCGARVLFFHEPKRGRVWEWVSPSWSDEKVVWIAGGTFCYRKGLWKVHPFEDVATAEDGLFLYATSKTTKPLALDDPRFYVATVHAANTYAYRPEDRSILISTMVDPPDAAPLTLEPNDVEVRELTTWQTSGPPAWAKVKKIRSYSAHLIAGQKAAWPECVTPGRRVLGPEEFEVLLITTHRTSGPPLWLPVRIERNEVQLRVRTGYGECSSADLARWKASRGPGVRDLAGVGACA